MASPAGPSYRGYNTDRFSPPPSRCWSVCKKLVLLGVGGGATVLFYPYVQAPQKTWQECAQEDVQSPDAPRPAMLRLETVMTVSRVFFGLSIDTVGAVVGRPLHSLVLERLQAGMLRPAVRKLLDSGATAYSAPLWAKAALVEACRALPIDGGIPCPSLHVVEAEAGRKMDTLPAGVWRRRHIIFVSKGLLESGILHEELQALFARELAHLSMGHWRLPRSWVLFHASGLANTAQKVWDSIPEDIGDDLRQAWAQVLELCRASSAAVAAARRARVLGEGLEMFASAGERWLSLEGHVYALADLCSVLEGPGSTNVKIHTLWTLMQRTGATVDLLPAISSQSADRVVRQAVSADRVVRQAKKASNQAQDWDYLRDNLKNLKLKELQQGLTSWAGSVHVDVDVASVAKAALRAWRPLLLLTLSVKRVAELAADRAAARSFGDRIEPVIAGLVRMYGTADECRRLDRGDVVGIIDGARAALAARSGLLRWELWWQGLVEGPTDPFLVLRIADLAAWAELPGDEGRFTPWRGAISWKQEQQPEDLEEEPSPTRRKRLLRWLRSGR